MGKFDELLREDEQATVEVELVTLSGVQTVEVEEGTTIKDFKLNNNLTGVKIVDEDGDVMRDSDIIDSDTQFYISTPKKNG